MANKDDFKLNKIEEERISEENMGSLNSRKKSRNSVNHSRVSSRTSKDLSITKLKNFGDKKTLFFDNPIQEMADQEIKSTNSVNEEKCEASLMNMEGLTENRRHSHLPVSMRLSSKIKNKFTKSFSKATNNRDQQNLKNSSTSVKTDYLSLSMKNSPADKGSSLRDGDNDREKFRSFHVQKLITNLKKGSLSIKKELQEATVAVSGTRTESALSKFVTSQVGQSLTVCPAQSKPAKDLHEIGRKTVNHRRTLSDTNSLNYQKTSKGIKSARNTTTLVGKAMKTPTVAMGDTPRKDDECVKQYSTMSNQSAKHDKAVHLNPAETEYLPVSAFITDFVRKAQPKTLSNVTKADLRENKRLLEENERLKEENLQQKKVGTHQPDH